MQSLRLLDQEMSQSYAVRTLLDIIKYVSCTLGGHFGDGVNTLCLIPLITLYNFELRIVTQDGCKEVLGLICRLCQGHEIAHTSIITLVSRV